MWGVRSAALDKGNRGYTGHEHLDFGLIHMNGRVYDPRWGRFLQADPIIQSPYDLQNYNRYSYVMNNPLSFTDPTGFSPWTRHWRPAIVAAIGNFICSGYPCGTVAVAYHNGGGRAAGWAVASYVAPVIAGFAEAGANGGGLKNGLFLAFANVAAMGGTGNIYADIALNAAGGCARGRVSGAGCANGAGNAVASQFVSAGVQAAGSAAVEYLSGDILNEPRYGRNQPTSVNDDRTTFIGGAYVTSQVNADGSISQTISGVVNFDGKVSRDLATWVVNSLNTTLSGSVNGPNGTITTVSTLTVGSNSADYREAFFGSPASIAGGPGAGYEIGGQVIRGDNVFKVIRSGINSLTVAHEFLHVLGLGHSGYGTGSMVSYDHLLRLPQSFTAGDRLRLHSLYGRK